MSRIQGNPKTIAFRLLELSADQNISMRFSLVIPAFNCRDTIEGTVKAGVEYLARHGNSSELIIVDDGSADGTAAVVERMVEKNPALRLVTNSTNRGKGHAVRAGVLQSRGDRVVFTDADMAYPLPEVDKILSALDAGADVAVATRVAAESRYIMSPTFFGYLYSRHVGSRIFNRLVRVYLGLSTFDCQAGLKGFQRHAADKIFSRQTLPGFTFDVEVLYIAKRFNLDVREVPVDFRYFSEPTTVSFMMDGLRAIRDVVKLR